MSDIIEIPNIENTNERIDWIEVAIKNEYLKYYEFKNFSNVKEICSGGLRSLSCELENFWKLFSIKIFFSILIMPLLKKSLQRYLFIK